MSRPQNDFDGSLEVLFDPDANRALLLDPATPVEVRGGGRGRRFAFARVGLSVVAISGLCLLPALSPAQGAPAAADPVVSPVCQITDTLADGTPSGVLGDGSVCVLPPTTGPTPPVVLPDEPAKQPPAASDEPAKQPPAASAPQAPPAPRADPPAANAPSDAPAGDAASASASATAPAAADTSVAAPPSKTSAAPVSTPASSPSAKRAPSLAKKKASGRRASSSKRAQRRARTNLRHRIKPRAKRAPSRTQLHEDVGVGASLHRPPGHHAKPARAMGFCLFGNAAVAAQHALDAHGAQRVMIFDWDVHHGNGTNAIFHARDDVLFCSIHQSPLYPGTGPASDVGSGPGEGYTVNMPVPAGSGDDVFLSHVAHVVAPLARAFAPDLLLISAGYDAHADDPLASCVVSDAGFAGMAALMRACAAELGIALGIVLEGGYDLGALSRSVVSTLEAVGASDPVDPPSVAVHPLALRVQQRLSAGRWPALR
ncbi:MAG: histone deacetylase [Actinobacteria bacterium]|nr:histone deacetylase [Actinomycetota bacterium]